MHWAREGRLRAKCIAPSPLDTPSPSARTSLEETRGGKVFKVCFSAAIAAAIFFSQQACANDDVNPANTSVVRNKEAAGNDAWVWYVGGSFGQGRTVDYCANLNSSYTCKQTDSSLKGFAGFQFNRWIAVEFDYMKLPKATLNGSGTWTGFQCTPPAIPCLAPIR